jgi:hypothetical protein
MNHENIQKCASFKKYNLNLSPLDGNLRLRYGFEAAKCKFMREPRRKKINGRCFMSGGSVMPDGLLNFVPSGNAKYLNAASRKRKEDLSKNLDRPP